MLLSDNAVSRVEDDDFGFRGHAEILCDAIEATTQLPLTIGIFGPWGSGKSSFMNICRDLLAKRGLSTVTFNPWKYDAKEQIWHALIQTVLTEIIQTAGDETQRRGADIAKKLSLTQTFSGCSRCRRWWRSVNRPAGLAGWVGGWVSGDRG